MTTTVIISVYKDTESLGLILKNLERQSLVPTEIIVSEDGTSEEMKTFLTQHQNVKHVFQEDKGWQKNKALNNAIKNSSSDYLIFLDGDVIPYRNFVKEHINNSVHKKILMGKRIELGKHISSLLRKNHLSASVLEYLFLPFLPFIALDKDSRHIEDGLILKNFTYIGKYIRAKKRKMIIGCNFSCFKSDLELINGFDEDYIKPSVGEDVDLMWRFKHFNIEINSVRNLANIFHLWHPRRWDGETVRENNVILKKKQENGEFRCKNGMIKEIREERI
jgi:glycosyltransferase involved in cell wall biosynthesis